MASTQHIVNNETGDHIPCDAFGKAIPPFHPGITGVADTKERLSLELKDVAWDKTLQKEAPPRPGPLPNHLLRERVSTTNRFGGSSAGEIDLYLREKQRLLLQFPEREEARAEEEAKARHKVEELHKNYYALMASSDINQKPPQPKKPKEFSLMKSEWYAFTSTGTYRP